MIVWRIYLRVDLLIDFTTPEVVFANIKVAIEQGIDIIVGTTGLGGEELIALRKIHQDQNKVLIVPNFAIGVVLIMKFAKQAVKFMDNAEIIEFHHQQKLESPSGTAVKTAELMAKIDNGQKQQEEIEKIAGSRGAKMNGINIHSIRLPGLVSHQEVIFGSLGQSLTLRFDSIGRESFMPGLKMVIDSINDLDGIIYGFERILDL